MRRSYSEVRGREKGTSKVTNIESPCPTCSAPSVLEEVGTASGRGHYCCPKCGRWREKNPAAVALGALGGQARMNGMSPEARTKLATDAAEKRWREVKLRRNLPPIRGR